MLLKLLSFLKNFLEEPFGVLLVCTLPQPLVYQWFHSGVRVC